MPDDLPNTPDGLPPEADTPEAAEAAAERFRTDFKRLQDEIAKAVVGQRAVVDGVLTCLFTGGHALLEGVPGIGKTLLVRTLADALSLSFGRVQFTPDLMPADITGTTAVYESDDEQGRRVRTFKFEPGPVFHQIVLADEINRATPKTQSALLEAMQERSVTVAGETHRLPSPFLVMATQNPVEQEGTYPLPEAQLDRFFFKILVGAPDREEMGEVLRRTTTGHTADVRPVLDAGAIEAHQRLIRQVQVAPSVQDYAVRIVLGTHPKNEGVSGGDGGRWSTPMVDKAVRMGASPRAAQSILLASKCRALVDGRAAIATDDVRAAALPALRHRIILNFEGEAEGVTPDQIISNLVETMPIDAD
ncbi:MAG: MoxR family ATPase [Planctomycetota bacterium]